MALKMLISVYAILKDRKWCRAQIYPGLYQVDGKFCLDVKLKFVGVKCAECNKTGAC